jgi:hypothetical protein
MRLRKIDGQICGRISLEQARTEYFMWLTADDYLFPIAMMTYDLVVRRE